MGKEEGKGGREEAREEKEGSSTMLSMGGERKDTWAAPEEAVDRGSWKWQGARATLANVFRCLGY